MKSYEDEQVFTNNLPLIVRIDGRHFHSLVKHLKLNKPFDDLFIESMNSVGKDVANDMSNFRLAYIQSDEISFLLYPKTYRSQPWFGNKIQKVVSSASALASSYMSLIYDRPIQFDARAFVLPPHEVVNYFIWRQRDWTRNSVQMMARSLYSQKQLHGKNQSAMQDMIHDKGQNWNDLPVHLRRGRCIIYENEKYVVDNDIPIFTEDRGYVEKHVVMED